VNAQVKPTAEPATRERILRIAFQLFHEQGFHATGVATNIVTEWWRTVAGWVRSRPAENNEVRTQSPMLVSIAMYGL
jgi:hypothetical protein